MVMDGQSNNRTPSSTTSLPQAQRTNQPTHPPSTMTFTSTTNPNPNTQAAEIPQRFPDGVFTYPEACPTGRCKNRLFELLRDRAETVDFQKIKVRGELREGGGWGVLARLSRGFGCACVFLPPLCMRELAPLISPPPHPHKHPHAHKQTTDPGGGRRGIGRRGRPHPAHRRGGAAGGLGAFVVGFVWFGLCLLLYCCQSPPAYSSHRHRCILWFVWVVGLGCGLDSLTD
jgi:hypothetical protein